MRRILQQVGIIAAIVIFMLFLHIIMKTASGIRIKSNSLGHIGMAHLSFWVRSLAYLLLGAGFGIGSKIEQRKHKGQWQVNWLKIWIVCLPLFFVTMIPSFYFVYLMPSFFMRIPEGVVDFSGVFLGYQLISAFTKIELNQETVES